MTLRSIMLQLRDDQIAQLDADAARVGTSRSKLVRDAVDARLSPDLDHDVEEQYRRAYPDGAFGVDEWGDLDEWHHAAATNRHDHDRGEW